MCLLRLARFVFARSVCCFNMKGFWGDYGTWELR